MKVLFILILIMFSFNVMAETKIKITLDSGKEVLATINDTKTSRDLLSRLPLNITMTDLFGREKYYNFNEPLENSDKKEYTYNKGDIFYWPPQHSFVIIYRQDNDTIPNGMYMLGHVDNNIELFDNKGKLLNVKIELLK